MDLKYLTAEIVHWLARLASDPLPTLVPIIIKCIFYANWIGI